MQRLIRLLSCVVIILLLMPAVPAKANTLPDGFIEIDIATNLGLVTGFEFAPDGRIFVTTQDGKVRVIKNGGLLREPFLKLDVNMSPERGLLGITFDPEFASNQYVYLYYTVSVPPIHNRLSRFTANGDVVLEGSEVPLLDIEPLLTTSHNGGDIHFGPDGKLYVAVGENAIGANAQTLENRLGKILRINADGTIPTDNPFYETALGTSRAIWAVGLRNPYRFTFQPGTNRMFINDVGENMWEEINEGIAGGNYGWPENEGYSGVTPFISPLYVYPHKGDAPTGCAITGGAFYNPPTAQFPAEYVGKYFFTDFCGAWIYYVDPEDSAPLTPTLFSKSASAPVDLEVGSDGSLYYAARGGDGSIRKIGYRMPLETIGVYHADETTFSLQDGSMAEIAALTVPFATRDDVPIVGDWNGDGIDTVGVFRPSEGRFLLSDDTSNPIRLTYEFVFGSADTRPLVGDWDGDGKDGVGVFGAGDKLIILRNSLTAGEADFEIMIGNVDDIGLAGDWNADGIDTVGVFRPTTNEFFLSEDLCTCVAETDYYYVWGSKGDVPLVGDWDGDGRTGIGLFRSSDKVMYLRNDATISGAAVTKPYTGNPTDVLLVGRWQ
jgi:glucose/arabinose dehydrogenase